MIAVIAPLVKVANNRWRPLKAVMTFTAGSLLATSLVGGLLMALNHWLTSSAYPWPGYIPGLVAAAFLVLAVCDLGLGGLRTLTTRRQTCAAWRRSREQYRVWFGWGFDLGLGFSTIRVTSLFWAVVVGVALLPVSWFIPPILMFYSFGFTAAFAIASWLTSHLGQRDIIEVALLRNQLAVRRAAGIVLMAATGGLLLQFAI